MAFTEKYFWGLNSEGFHKIVYNDWGPAAGRPLICVHGLTGNGHDFDFLAEDLVQHGYRVIAVDLAGRGRSDFLNNPRDYNYQQYWQDLTALLAHLDIIEPGSVDWLGVSLGGLLGMHLAALPNSPIGRMIVNDVAPEVPQAALAFIHQVISQSYSFKNIEEMEQRMRATRGLSWGPVTDEQWHHMAEHNARALEDGTLTYGYDPEIAVVFEDEPIGPLNLWEAWDKITCPILLIQGADSLLLTDDLVDEMQQRGLRQQMDLAVFEGCGHVPSLMAPDQIRIIREWLSTAPTS